MGFDPKPKHRRRVMVCAGSGMAHDEIARALGITEQTLRAYFETELSIGAAHCRANVLERIYRQAINAKKPSVAAAKFYLQGEPALACPPHGDVIDVTPVVRLGKKEQADRDATTAAIGTAWERLLPSRPNQ